MDVLEFSQRHPWKPAFPASQVQRFLTELISCKEFMLELRDDQGLRAAAVLIDEVQNPANDACFEFLAIRPGEDERDCARELITRAFALVPARRSGMQLAVPEGSSLDEEFLATFGLEYYFAAYEMEKNPLSRTASSNGADIVLGTKRDAADVYAVLEKSFAENLEMSAPSFESWNQRFLKAPTARYYLIRDKERLVAFAHLSLDPAEEAAGVRMIGVLPESRGKGLGGQLLRHCLAEAAAGGKTRAELSVAAANESALGLYAREGFKVTEKYLCYHRTLARGGSIWES